MVRRSGCRHKGIDRGMVTLALVGFIVTGCGTTVAPSASDALSPATATTESTAPATTTSATTAPVITAAPPEVAPPVSTTTVPAQTPRVSNSVKQRMTSQAPVTRVPVPRPPALILDSTDPPKPKTTGPVTSFGDGTYVVGTDIVAGTYKTNPSSQCYWARIRGTDESDILSNHLASGPTTVTISSSDGAFVSNRCGQWTKTDASLLPNAPLTSFGDGTYVVGTDIEPGTYKATPSGQCYWARLSSTADESDIIANHLASGPTTVTISNTDAAFLTNRCGAWTKVG